MLWARHKIESLLDSRHQDANTQNVRAAVVEVGLAHHLVSRYTSLVAVDVTPSRPDAEALKSGSVPTNLPHGWDYAKVFGALPQTATFGALHLWSAVLCGLLALLIWVTCLRSGRAQAQSVG